MDALLMLEWFLSAEMRQFHRSQFGCSLQGRMFPQMV